MKIKILNEGIYNGTRSSIIDTRDSLQQARNTNMYCPSSFSRVSEVRALKEDIQDMIRTLRKISDALYHNDLNYRNHGSNEIRRIRRLKEASLKARNGL